MNILLIGKNFDFGGAEKHIRELANAMHGLGHRVSLATRAGWQRQRLAAGVRHYPVAFSDTAVLWQALRLAQLVRRAEIDVIHAHQRLGILAGCLAGRLTDTPVVATVHGKIRHDLRSGFVRDAVSRVIVVSRNSFTGAQRVDAIKRKARLIHNGIRFGRPRTDPPVANGEVLYVGRLNRRHARVIHMLIDEVWPSLLHRYPDVQLGIAGDGRRRNEIRRRVERENAALGREVFRWYGARLDLEAVLRAASLVIGVGRVAIESLGLGIPVLSVNGRHGGALLDRWNYAELAYGNFVAIDAPPPAPRDLLLQIGRFFDHRDHYDAEAKELSGGVRRTFDVEQVAKATLDVYECRTLLGAGAPKLAQMRRRLIPG